jgi:amino acid adenylation domain-containing protein
VGSASIQFSAELSRRIQSFAAEPLVVLLAGFQALLSRYSGQDDIVVGVPLGATAGPSGSPIPIRVSLAGDPSFQELVQRVQADVRIDAILRDADGQNCPFQVTLGSSPAHVPSAPFDLTINVADGLKGTLEFSTDLFDQTTAERMVGHLQVLLDAATTYVNQPISRLPLLTEDERKTILGAWAGDVAKRAPAQSVTELLDAQGRKTPSAAAVVFGDQSLSYAELHGRANQLAHHLRSLGVGPDVLTGVALQRTPDLLIAVLAVLKAGAAYVPLDPAYPKDRLTKILEDAKTPLLITQSDLRDSLPSAPQVVCINTDWPTIAAYSDEPPEPVGGPNSLAYVIYTSGSTGKPKGVAVEHRSVIELIRWAADAYSADELAGVLFGTSVCFDLSVFEMFVPLSLGGTIILADNAIQLPTLPARDRVTLLNTVPSAAAELVRTGVLPPSVRVVNLAGEPLPDDLAQAIYAVPTVRKLFNLYGPTEDTVYSTCSLVDRGKKVHLGRPLPNTRGYILDRHGQPVPAGVPGELHLAGAGLARGYLNRPELTNERFIPDAFATDGRMYKTGDLCRWRADGTIDFHGRIDHQVKVRGFRVELGEIESALSKQAGVRQALVTAADDPAGGKRLVAYVAGESLPVGRLRGGLRRTLPEYMVPSVFVPLDRFPLTPNGKVDRKRLPAPTWGERVPTSEPRDELERKLVGILQDVLGVSPIGTADDFFDLGGHSLIAVRLVHAIEREFGRQVPVGSLLRNPTIAQLAELIREPKPTVEMPLLVCLQDGPGVPLFCVPGQGDHGFQFRDLARRVGPNRQVYAFSYERWEREPDLYHTVEDLAELFLAEVRRVQPTGPYRFAGFCLGGWFAFEMARRLRTTGDVVEQLVLIENYGPPHSPVANASRRERLLQLARYFARLRPRAKLRFVCERARRILARFQPQKGSSVPTGEPIEVGPGARESYLCGVYRARPIPGKMEVLRAAGQPEWFRKFGDDAPDLGWAGFAKGGIFVTVIPCGHDDVMKGPGLDHIAARLRARHAG